MLSQAVSQPVFYMKLQEGKTGTNECIISSQLLCTVIRKGVLKVCYYIMRLILYCHIAHNNNNNNSPDIVPDYAISSLKRYRSR